MIINLVVAATENNVIGKDNKLLWHLPNDLAFFKNTTWGMPVIMGRKTFEAMGKPLRGRTNIIITRNPADSDLAKSGEKDIILVPSVNDALTASGDTDAKECYVIGGGEIFLLTLPIANRIYMTRVHTQLDGDTFFPPINEKEWILASTTSFEADTKHAFPYSFEIWQRK
jgi:dihydrofolate reductase